MTQVFISFRKNDEPYGADHLDRELCREFGNGAVFFAPRSIGPGEPWEATIFDAVSEADVMLVVIGPRWLAARDDDGERRIDDPADFVRREVELALHNGKRVVPVHLEDRHGIDPDRLPESLRPLAEKQGVVVRFRDSRPDIAKLAAKLRAMVPALRGPAKEEPGGGHSIDHNGIIGNVERSTVIQGDNTHIGSMFTGDFRIGGDFTTGAP